MNRVENALAMYDKVHLPISPYSSPCTTRYISLYLPYISPTSPVYLPYRSLRAIMYEVWQAEASSSG